MLANNEAGAQGVSIILYDDKPGYLANIVMHTARASPPASACKPRPTRPCTARMAGVRIDAPAVGYDHARCEHAFLANRPCGPDAHTPYLKRIKGALHREVTQAFYAF